MNETEKARMHEITPRPGTRYYCTSCADAVVWRHDDLDESGWWSHSERGHDHYPTPAVSQVV